MGCRRESSRPARAQKMSHVEVELAKSTRELSVRTALWRQSNSSAHRCDRTTPRDDRRERLGSKRIHLASHAAVEVRDVELREPYA